MTMKIISQSRLVTSVSYHLSFDRGDGSGYAFDCDEHGNVSIEHDAARENYAQCLTGADRNGVTLHAMGVQKDEHTYRVPAVGLCGCGAHVELDGFTNTCDGCDADYNSAGQRLAPREQWGEETGEPWYECY